MAAVASIQLGDRLTVVDNPENEHNSLALMLRVSDGRRLGWIPGYLVDHVHEPGTSSGKTGRSNFRPICRAAWLASLPDRTPR